MKIRLEPVTVASRAAVERLETAPGQEGFVESVAECLAEADRRRCWRPVGVYDGDALIGFAMYGFFWASCRAVLSMQKMSTVSCW